MRVFEIGETVHILDSPVTKEMAEAAGVEHSPWPDYDPEEESYENWCGFSATIINRFEGTAAEVHGFMYKIHGSELDWYGQDFKEFYDEIQTNCVSKEDILELLG